MSWAAPLEDMITCIVAFICEGKREGGEGRGGGGGLIFLYLFIDPIHPFTQAKSSVVSCCLGPVGGRPDVEGQLHTYIHPQASKEQRSSIVSA